MSIELLKRKLSSKEDLLFYSSASYQVPELESGAILGNEACISLKDMNNALLDVSSEQKYFEATSHIISNISAVLLSTDENSTPREFNYLYLARTEISDKLDFLIQHPKVKGSGKRFNHSIIRQLKELKKIAKKLSGQDFKNKASGSLPEISRDWLSLALITSFLPELTQLPQNSQSERVIKLLARRLLRLSGYISANIGKLELFNSPLDEPNLMLKSLNTKPKVKSHILSLCANLSELANLELELSNSGWKFLLDSFEILGALMGLVDLRAETLGLSSGIIFSELLWALDSDTLDEASELASDGYSFLELYGSKYKGFRVVNDQSTEMYLDLKYRMSKNYGFSWLTPNCLKNRFMTPESRTYKMPPRDVWFKFTSPINQPYALHKEL